MALPRSIESVACDGRPVRFQRTGREVALLRPNGRAVRSLRVGDVVLVSGRLTPARDAVHHHLRKNAPPVDLRGGVIYHCGPSS